MGFTDHADMGFLPLQDHGQNIPVSLRKMIAGGRVVRAEGGSDATSAGGSMLEYGRVNGLGTLGDVHPWIFWQTAGRDLRGMGSWAQAFGAMVSSGGGFYDPKVSPIGGADFAIDSRYAELIPKYPKCFPRLVRGQQVIMLPATSESSQVELAFNADPRLISPNASGPAEAGTLVVDLQPDSEICAGDTPGIGGRAARLQSMIRVVPIKGQVPMLGGRGNILALNHTRSEQDHLPGFGAVWTTLVGGQTRGPITPPTTRGPVTSPTRTGFGSGLFGPQSEDEPTPCEFGKFKAKDFKQNGVAFMAHGGAFGPLHGGAYDDKHRLGVDADGQPMNSGHIATNAYFFRSRDNDGPLFFEGNYPTCQPFPLKARTHLTWDGGAEHRWINGNKEGMWRWWTEVPYVAPSDEPPGGGPTTPPGDTGPPGPGRPGRPGNPGPTTPPTGPPGDGPGPTTPRDPRQPKRPRDPGVLPTPITPPTGSPLPPYPGYVRPAPDKFKRRRPGPTTPDEENPSVVAPDKDPKKEEEKREEKKGPITPDTRGGNMGHIIPVGPNWGRGAGGTGPNRPLSIDARIGGGGTTGPQSRRAPGTVDTVGESHDVRGTYSILHPMQETFGALGFRPQLWVESLPNFEHNAELPAAWYEADERTRPQVVTLRAWGRQSDSGDWDYETKPGFSRARGGHAKGGVVFTPPLFEMEDYLDIGTVLTNPTARETSAYVALAQGVGLGFGEPMKDGGVAEKGFVAHRLATGTSGADRDLCFDHVDNDRSLVRVLSMRRDQAANENVVTLHGTAAVRVPLGTTAQRPSTIPVAAGMFRVNSSLGTVGRMEFNDGTDWQSSYATDEHVNSSAGAGDAGKPIVLNSSGVVDSSMVNNSGANESINFTDDGGSEHNITIVDGIITAWAVT